MERKTYLGRYRIIADESETPVEIRRGQDRVSYKAEDLNTGEEVVLEIISGLERSSESHEEWAEEARGAKELEHINVPKLHSFGREGDEFLYASEYFDGTTSEEWVTEHGPMPVGPVLRIALQVVSTLGAATYHGIVHGAINPRNILLVPGQTAQGDWPLVKILQLVGPAPTFTGSQFAGAEREFTSQFASPEQLENGTVDFRAEMYSLGATLWFLLTGIAPEPGAERPQVSGLPKPVLQLLEQMLARNPDDRPHDPVAFEEHLRSCLEQVERREAIGRRFGVPVAVAAPPIKVERRAIPWRPLTVAAVFLFLATLGAFLLPENLRPTRWFAGSTPPDKPIGVPVGVPESVARAAASQPTADSSVVPSDVQPSETTAPAAVAANPVTPSIPEAPSPTPAKQLMAISPPAPPAERVARVEPVRKPTAPVNARGEAAASLASAKMRKASASAEAVPVPATPAEGPAETSAPANYAAREPGTADRVREEEEDSRPARPVVAQQEAPDIPEPVERVETINGLPVRRAEPVPDEEPVNQRTTRANSRPTRLDGMEVRRAEPVYEPEPGPVPGLPKRSQRARYIGTTPEGELVFEVPSEERGYVSPRR